MQALPKLVKPLKSFGRSSAFGLLLAALFSAPIEATFAGSGMKATDRQTEEDDSAVPSENPTVPPSGIEIRIPDDFRNLTTDLKMLPTEGSDEVASAEANVENTLAEDFDANPSLKARLIDDQGTGLDSEVSSQNVGVESLSPQNFRLKLKSFFQKIASTSTSPKLWVIARILTNAGCLAVGVVAEHRPFVGSLWKNLTNYSPVLWKSLMIGAAGGLFMGALQKRNNQFMDYVNADGIFYKFFKNSKLEWMKKLRGSGQFSSAEFKDELAKQIDGFLKITLVFELGMIGMLKALQIGLGIQDAPGQSFQMNVLIGSLYVITTTLSSSLFQNPLEATIAADTKFAVERSGSAKSKWIKRKAAAWIGGISVLTTLLGAFGLQGAKTPQYALTGIGAAGVLYSLFRINARLKTREREAAFRAENCRRLVADQAE